MSHCDKYIEMASLYIDGELPENEVPELMEHLAGCRDCRRYYEVFSGVSDALGDEVKAPEGFAAAVMDAVGAAAAPKKAVKPRRRGLVAKYAAMAACLALVIAAGVRLASPASDGAANGENEPAAYNATGSVETEPTERDTELYGPHADAASVTPNMTVGMNPTGSGSNCVSIAQSVTVTGANGEAGYTDSETVDAIVTLLRYGGQSITAVPDTEAEYIVTVDGDRGSTRLRVWCSGPEIICQLEEGIAWTALGSSEALEAIIG